ncbi:universal stress protein [Naumannella halotolerans]|uniref:universal stress protein n=1 Tax=Naumannella halotolerans TaxID=993414 RepID=UPI00370D330E
MTVLVARTTTPESAAAIQEAIAEAKRRSEDLAIFDLDGEPAEGLISGELDGVQVSYHGNDNRNRNAAAGLLDASVELGASVLVIGVKHRSAVGKLLLGSNAQSIILDAQIPVLAVKAPQD